MLSRLGQVYKRVEELAGIDSRAGSYLEARASVKAQVEGKVQAEIADQAKQAPPPAEAQKIDQVAGQFRAKAVEEVVSADREADRGREIGRAHV